MNQPTIAFIGAGNMTRAIFDGLIANDYPSDKLLVSNRSADKLKNYPVETSTDNVAIAKKAEIIILAVKPQQIASVCQEIKTICVTNKPLIISLAVGTTIEFIAEQLSPALAIIRSMPNTPAAIGYGATGLFANNNSNDEQREIAGKIFADVGKTIWVNTENLLDVVASVSGSGPAYYFLMMQAMLKGAENLGLEAELAKTLITQTVIGAAKLAEMNNNEFAKLRERVTSPNGTTFAAINYFQQHDFSEIVAQGMQAAVERAKEIAKNK